MARRVRYSVAASLDGFIADADGGYDWIPMDDAIDFAAFLQKIDVLLMGRVTFDMMNAAEGAWEAFADKEIVVVSNTLVPEDHPAVTVLSGDLAGQVAELKRAEGQDIWLFGGGQLFRGLAEAKLVDRVEIAVIPILLGAGVPLLPPTESPLSLVLHSTETFPDGIVLAKYDVVA